MNPWLQVIAILASYCSGHPMYSGNVAELNNCRSQRIECIKNGVPAEEDIATLVDNCLTNPKKYPKPAPAPAKPATPPAAPPSSSSALKKMAP